MECVATMAGRVTLTFPWAAGIEENAYLAYVFSAMWVGYVAAERSLTHGDEPATWAPCSRWDLTDERCLGDMAAWLTY